MTILISECYFPSDCPWVSPSTFFTLRFVVLFYVLFCVDNVLFYVLFCVDNVLFYVLFCVDNVLFYVLFCVDNVLFYRVSIKSVPDYKYLLQENLTLAGYATLT